MNPLMIHLLTIFLCLSLLGLSLVLVLYAFRSYRTRRARSDSLPTYNETIRSTRASRQSAITGSGRRPIPLFVYNEKQQLIAETDTPPTSPTTIPEIRITFPEEEDEYGKRKSGRVMLVRVSEIGVGLEPLDQHELPPYQKSSEEPFHSIDLNRANHSSHKAHITQ